MNLLFNQHLWQSLPLHAQRIVENSDAPFQDEREEYGDAVVDILQTFAETHADILDEDGLEEYFDEWCFEENGFAESTVRILKDVLNLSAEQEFGQIAEDNIRSLLKVLAHPLQSTETTVADIVDGRIPSLPSDAREFLRQLRVQKRKDSYGNSDAFSAKNLKVFDRAKARYGHSPASSMAGADNFPVLANPRLNVSENFTAIDAVGMDQTHQWIVVDVNTNQILTPYLMKHEAINLAASLNKQSEMLGESIVNANSSGQGYDEDHAEHPLHRCCVQHGFGYSHSTPVHMKNGDVKIHHTWSNGEHKVGAVEGSNHWTSKTCDASATSPAVGVTHR
jgi:hypothetical protein